MSQQPSIPTELDYQPNCSTFASPDPQTLSIPELQERIAYCERRIRQLTNTARSWTSLIIKAMRRPEVTSDDMLPLTRTERSSVEQIAVYTQEIALLKQILGQRQEQDHV